MFKELMEIINYILAHCRLVIPTLLKPIEGVNNIVTFNADIMDVSMIDANTNEKRISSEIL